MARLYANENFARQVVEELRRLGHDVVTTQDAGRANRASPDEAVLSFAANDGRALLTLNRKHFIRLHKRGVRHAGIVACTVDPDFAGRASRIHAAVTGASTLAGELIRVNRPPG